MDIITISREFGSGGRELGKNCVIVGRNADVILQEYHPFNIFVCASKEAKLKRCLERAGENEKLTVNTTEWKIKRLVPAVADFAACWFRRK